MLSRRVSRLLTIRQAFLTVKWAIVCVICSLSLTPVFVWLRMYSWVSHKTTETVDYVISQSELITHANIIMLLVKLIRLENQFRSFDQMKAKVFQGAGWARIGGRGLRPLASQWCFSDESHVHVPQFVRMGFPSICKFNCAQNAHRHWVMLGSIWLGNFLGWRASCMGKKLMCSSSSARHSLYAFCNVSSIHVCLLDTVFLVRIWMCVYVSKCLLCCIYEDLMTTMQPHIHCNILCDGTSSINLTTRDNTGCARFLYMKIWWQHCISTYTATYYVMKWLRSTWGRRQCKVCKP